MISSQLEFAHQTLSMYYFVNLSAIWIFSSCRQPILILADVMIALNLFVMMCNDMAGSFSISTSPSYDDHIQESTLLITKLSEGYSPVAPWYFLLNQKNSYPKLKCFLCKFLFDYFPQIKKTCFSLSRQNRNLSKVSLALDNMLFQQK